jgi:WD40 repeat protein
VNFSNLITLKLFIAWHCLDQPEPVLSLDCNPIQNKLATCGGDCTIKLWNLKENEEVEFRSTLKHQEKTVNCVRWSPSGKM